MSPIREEAVQLLERIPEDKIALVVKYMQHIEDDSSKDEDIAGKRIALQKICNMAGRLPENFDYKRELEEALDEKYSRTN